MANLFIFYLSIFIAGIYVNKLLIADNKITVTFIMLSKFKVELAVRRSQPRLKNDL